MNLHELVQAVEKVYPNRYIDLSRSFTKYSNRKPGDYQERYILYIAGVDSLEFVTVEALEQYVENLVGINI